MKTTKRIQLQNLGIPANIGGGLLALLLAFCTLPAVGQMAATSNGKFVGNVLRSTTTPDPAFDTYWNQATPENSGKWESVEATRDVMDWTHLDFIYAYTRARGIPFKQHTFVWGQQTPAWVTTLPANEQREEVEEWIAAFAARYPDTEFIDVVNEPLHAPAAYRAALGGNGTTGWDWVIWSFEKARQYFPNAKLLLNDYNIINSDSATTQYLTIINLLKERGLIDGIGEQAHFFESTSITTIQNNLARLAATGLPIYISELDVHLADDTAQSNRYQTLFPVFWTNPAVRGITFWGYKQGEIWRTNGYLLRTNGSERPAMTWLKNYVAANPQSFSASVTSPANGQGLGNVLPVSASATVAYGTAPFTVTFQKKLDHETEFTTVGSDNTAPYTANLGDLPLGTYQIRVIVTDSDSVTVTSPTNTFNVLPAAGATWLGTSGNWNDPGRWSGGTIANGADSTAIFTGVDIEADQTITLDGNRTIGNIVFTDATTPSHNLTISGANTFTLDVSSGVPVIHVTQADRTLSISSVVAGNDGLQKTGPGTLTVTGSNTYTGNTTINSGTLKLEGSGGGFFSSTNATRTYTINSGATLNLHGASVPVGSANLTGSGTLLLTGGGVSAGDSGRAVNVNLTAGSVIDIQSGSGLYNGGWQAFTWTNNKATLKIDGGLDIIDGKEVIGDALIGNGTITSAGTTGSPAINFTLGVNNGSGTFTGNITAAGNRVVSLVKIGTGSQTFSGSTTFRGTTTINAGTLQFAKQTSLYNNVSGDWTAAKINVKSGATIVLNVDSAATAGFSAASLNTLLGNISVASNSTAGLQLGATIGLDTSTATGGTFTQGNAIANSTGGSGGAIGLRKLGTGTLILDKANTYTGATTVSQGTLALAGGSQASAITVSTGSSLGLTLGSPTTSTAVVNLTNGTVKVTGAVDNESDYQLMTAASFTGTPVLDAPIPDYVLQLQNGGTELWLVFTGGGPGPVDHFAISAIASPQTVGTPISGITLTAQDAANQTLTAFTGTVTFGGTGGFSGTSASFVAGVLSMVSVTPTLTGSNLTLTVNDGAGHSGFTTIGTVRSRFNAWAAGPFAGTLTNPNGSLDFDNGGLPTGIEWVVVGDPTNGSDDIGKTPTFDNTTDPNYFIYTYRRSDVSIADANTTIAVQYSSDLTTWTAAVHDGTNIIITPTNDGAGAGIDIVQVKIKRTLAVGGKLFSRLHVTVAP